jgi:diadenylate cyclase
MLALAKQGVELTEELRHSQLLDPARCWQRRTVPRDRDAIVALLKRAEKLQDRLNEVTATLQGRYFAGLARAEIEEIAGLNEAIQWLGANRIGALVAVERKVKLDEYAKSGTWLDAAFSPELLLSLFQRASLLHDGAVILRGERILAAGCILPLWFTGERLRNRNLGTRHRAGLGLSEASDAVVFIVSEQTGAVSVAVQGEIFRAPFRERTKFAFWERPRT